MTPESIGRGVQGVVSCTGERLIVEQVDDLPPGVSEWRQALLGDVRHGGPSWASIRGGRCLLLDETHVAYEFAPDDPRITVWSDGHYSARYLDHLVRDHVVPRRLSMRGEIVLHATAVEFDGLAVGFVGVSTAGKSTLAAAGATAGGRILADDTLRLVVTDDMVSVLPTSNRCRLRADVALAMTRPPKMPPMNDGGVAVRLGLLCLLERGARRVELVPRPPAAGLVALARSAFGSESPEPNPVLLLDRLVPVVEHTSIVTLRYPDGFHRLPDVVDCVRRFLGSVSLESPSKPLSNSTTTTVVPTNERRKT